MANPFVFIDGKESNRLIPEPHIFRRIRRAKEVWNAFKFLVRGGKLKVYLDFSGIDPRILKPVKVTIGHDGRILDLERERHNAVSSAMQRLSRLAGLTLAGDDEHGFRVKWNGWTRKTAWEEAGFDVTHTPTEFIVAPKGVGHV